jgi:hypothetical protein
MKVDTTTVTTTITTITSVTSTTDYVKPTSSDLTHPRSTCPFPEELLMPEPGQKIEGYYLVTVGRECGIFFTLYVLSYRCYRLLTFAPMQEGSLC